MIMAKAKDKKIKKENNDITETKNAVKIENINKNVSKTEVNVSVNEKSSNHGAWILALIFAAMVILALSYGYNNILEKNMLKKGCSELSNSPELKYPTVCVPLDADSNRGDYVDTQSDPMCRCKVDMGNGTSTIIDIRLAK